MAVKIRLTRIGKHKRPFYRVIVKEARSPRDGKFVENLGTYDPLVSENGVNLKEDRILYWIGQGAEVSGTMASILKKRPFFKKTEGGSSQ